MARTVGHPSRTGIILFMVTCALVITGQIFTISGTPGPHVVSWVLIACTLVLFIAAVVYYRRQGRRPGSPPDRT